MAIYWPTPCFQGRTFKLCVLTRWDFNFCVRSSPLRGTRTERGACCSVSQHHIVGTDDKDTGQCLAAPYRTTGRQKKTTHHKVSLSKDKQEQKTGAYNSSMLCSFFQLLHWEYIFKSFVRLCADSLAMRDSRAIFFFSHWDVWFAEHTHRFPFGVVMLRWVPKSLCGHFVLWLKHVNNPVKMSVAFFGKFYR